MNEMIQMIPIERIRVLNPRFRDRVKFQPIVESIKTLGLKKPIQVSVRSVKEGEQPGYDLVCGQGRIEACLAAGFTEVAAVVVDIPKAERLLRSLVENMARRFPSTGDLIDEIERLKALNYSNIQIGEKLGLNDTVVGGYLSLKRSGELGLLNAAIQGKIPVGVAIDIAKTDSIEAQRELLKAYERGDLNKAAIRTVKRLIVHRRFIGKNGKGQPNGKPRTSADALVNVFKRETQRQKMIIRKSKLCDGKLLLLVQAFGKLMGDENFITLLRAEGLTNMPEYLSERIAPKGRSDK